MPGSCTYKKRDGTCCGMGMRVEFLEGERCSRHRYTPPIERKPCTSCGKPTGRPSGLCIARSCGWNEYRRELRIRKKALAVATQLTAKHNAADPVSCVATVAAQLTAQQRPPAAWTALSEESQAALREWLVKPLVA
jgi:hypothetical protein